MSASEHVLVAASAADAPWLGAQGLLLALAAAGHCAGMCGAFAAHAAARGARGSAAYLAGKTATYVALGALAGAAGAGVLSVLRDGQPWLALLAGLALAAAGVRLLRARDARGVRDAHDARGARDTATRLGGGRAGPGAAIVRALSPLYGGLLREGLPGGRFTLGAVSGLLPCGVLGLALLRAAALGSPAPAALFMACFGLGTAPALLAAGWLLRRAVPRRRLARAGGVLLLLLAGLALARGAAPLWHAPCPACEATDAGSGTDTGTGTATGAT